MKNNTEQPVSTTSHTFRRISPLTQAADLGTWGDLWPVREQDMLQLITQRLQSLQSSGQWDQTMDAFKQRVIENSQRPAPVEGIKRAEKYEQRWFDPSIRLTEDLKDNEGRVFARKGDVVNPLKTVPFVQTLYFINGDDADQLAWMKRQVPETLMSKIILVRGSIPDTSAALDIGDVIRGLERDRPGTEKTTLPDDPQFRRQEEAILQVASERLQRERLQAVERDMVRDLNREKTLGGD